MLKVDPKLQTPFSTPWGTWLAGQEIPVAKIPRSILESWVNTGYAVPDESPPETIELPEEDVLTGMSRRRLLSLIRPNNMFGKVQPTTDWSDENIRQAIRTLIPDLSKLIVPEIASEQV